VGHAAPAFSLQRISSAQTKGFAKTGRLHLTISANVPGRLSATAVASVAGTTRNVASASQTLRTAGKAPLTLRLSKVARDRLAASGKLTVKITVASSRVAAAQHVTLKLTHATAKPSAGKRAAVRIAGGRSGGRS